MKLFKTILASAVLCSSMAFAADKALDPDISTTMVKLEDGLNQIQKGFLYNNIELIKSGLAEVKKENTIYHDPKKIISMLPKDKMQMKNAAILTSNRIDAAANEMAVYLKLNKLRSAYDSYAAMLNACTDCHIIVRGW